MLKMVRRILTVSACLCAIAFASSRAASADPLPVLERPESSSCGSAASATFADFDKNGVLDRVTLGVRGISVTMNGRQSNVLSRAIRPCRLIVLDIDHDRDQDLVVLTTRNHMLVWRNRSGALTPERPRTGSACTESVSKPGSQIDPCGSAVLDDRHLSCDTAANFGIVPRHSCAIPDLPAVFVEAVPCGPSQSRAPPLL